MSKVIDEVRHKVACEQNLFRRSTIEKMLLEYDRLLLRNTALEKQATQQSFAVDGATCSECGGSNGGHYVTCSQVPATKNNGSAASLPAEKREKHEPIFQ